MSEQSTGLLAPYDKPHGPVSLQAICDRWNLHLGAVRLSVCGEYLVVRDQSNLSLGCPLSTSVSVWEIEDKGIEQALSEALCALLDARATSAPIDRTTAPAASVGGCNSRSPLRF